MGTVALVKAEIGDLETEFELHQTGGETRVRIGVRVEDGKIHIRAEGRYTSLDIEYWKWLEWADKVVLAREMFERMK